MTAACTHGEHIIDGYLRVFDSVTGAVNKYGYQNPYGYYQVSTWNVTLPSWQYGTGFDYVTPSQIGLAADRWDCIDVFINTAYSYIGTPYILGLRPGARRGRGLRGLGHAVPLRHGHGPGLVHARRPLPDARP